MVILHLLGALLVALGSLVQGEIISIDANGFSPARQPAMISDISPIRTNTGVLLNINLNAVNLSFSNPSLLTVVPASQQTATSSILVYCEDEDSYFGRMLVGGSIQFFVTALSGKQLVISMRSPSFYAYDDAGFRLIFLRQAFFPASAASNLPFTASYTFRREATSIEFPTRVEVASSALGTFILSFAARDSHLALLSTTRLAVLERVLECNVELGYLLHPTQVTVGYGEADSEYGAILMSFGLLIVVTLLHAIIFQRIPKVFPQFPGEYWLIAVGLMCPISVACMQTLILTSAPMLWILGGIILLMFYILFILFFVLSHDPKNVRYSTSRKRWEHRNDPNFVGRWSVFYASFKPNRRLAFIVELVITGILCGLSSYDSVVAGPRGCFIKSVCATALLVCEWIFFLITRPFVDWIDLRIVLVFELFEIAVSAMAIANSVQDIPNSIFVFAGQIIILSGAGIMFLKALVVVILIIVGRRPFPARTGLLARPEEGEELRAIRSNPSDPRAAGSQVPLNPGMAQQQPQAQLGAGPNANNPLASAAMDYHARLFRFYSYYAPEKLTQVNTILTKSKGAEEQLFAQLVAKYGPEPKGGEGPIARGLDESSIVQNTPAPKTGPMSPLEFKERVTRFYQHYCPEKLSFVDEIVNQSVGNEHIVMLRLIEKYGPEPAPPATQSGGGKPPVGAKAVDQVELESILSQYGAGPGNGNGNANRSGPGTTTQNVGRFPNEPVKPILQQPQRQVEHGVGQPAPRRSLNVRVPPALQAHSPELEAEIESFDPTNPYDGIPHVLSMVSSPSREGTMRAMGGAAPVPVQSGTYASPSRSMRVPNPNPRSPGVGASPDLSRVKSFHPELHEDLSIAPMEYHIL
jgi:hypothetical protein